MKGIWTHLTTTLAHKFRVFVNCCKLGIPLRGLIHDWHKFLPDEWVPCVRMFGEQKRDGRFQKVEWPSWFMHAQIKHVHRGKHHWQHWVSWKNDGEMIISEMDEVSIKEAVADMTAASDARGVNVIDYFMQHKDKWHLHPKTAEKLERYLREFNNG